MQDICANLQRIQEVLDETAHRCRRDPAGIKLVAVSKTFPAEFIVSAASCGQIAFGENRIQEAEEKIPRVEKLLGERRIEWHLIGHLQSNKARPAARFFDVIQSIDSARIARKLSRYVEDSGRTMPVFVQVNVGEESQKYGVPPADTAALVDLVDSLPGLDPIGLMSIPPYHEEAERSRPYFRRLARLLEEINRCRRHPLRELSMGMSADFRVAVEEGATVVRIGSAIFGPRELP